MFNLLLIQHVEQKCKDIKFLNSKYNSTGVWYKNIERQNFFKLLRFNVQVSVHSRKRSGADFTNRLQSVLGLKSNTK